MDSPKATIHTFFKIMLPLNRNRASNRASLLNAMNRVCDATMGGILNYALHKHSFLSPY
jgi:hypothetical protein